MNSTSRYYKRSSEFIAADMDGDKVMMSLQHGNYFGLIGGVSSRVWDLLSEPIQLEDMINRITNEFEVDESTCCSDLEMFIEVLLKNDLILVTNDKP